MCFSRSSPLTPTPATVGGGWPNLVSTLWSPSFPPQQQTLLSGRIQDPPPASLGFPHHVVGPSGVATAFCTGGPLCNHALALHGKGGPDGQLGVVSGKIG